MENNTTESSLVTESEISRFKKLETYIRKINPGLQLLLLP